ncbi:MAG: hypothetical protein PHU03_03010 [Syntrophales bacterium]|nr:hypothetical protein [Syntrophales bacterium]
MSMDKETREAIEKVAHAHDSLSESLDGQESRITGQDDRIKRLEEMMGTMEGSLRDHISNSGSTLTNEGEPGTAEPSVEENARLHDTIGKLEERIAFLEGTQYENEVIQKFLRDLDSDNYLAIGQKLGYLEETEAAPEDLEGVEGAEIPLGDSGSRMMVQREKPEDMTGWEYSETQGVYIKVLTE